MSKPSGGRPSIASKKNRVLSRTDLKLLENKDQPVKATVIYIIYTVLKSLGFVFAKMLYNRNPDLTTFQMLTIRSVVAFLYVIIW